MARIFLSPLIVDIRAKQSDTVFSKWRGINYIRSRVVPANPKTGAQILVREALAHLVGLWQASNPTLKLNRNFYASGKSESGFNTFVGDNAILEAGDNVLNLLRDNGYQVLTVWTPTTGTASGEIDVSFQPDPVPAGKKLVYYTREIDSLVWERKAEWAAAVSSPQTITGLTPDTLYQVYGWLEAVGATTGDEVGDDSGGSATSQS